jgi:iron complex transport system ATP-binding protein
MKSLNLPIKSISVRQSDAVIHVQSELPLVTLSSALFGGGYRWMRHILNAHVARDFNSPNPKAWLRSFAKDMNIREPFVGLLTAVKLRKARIAFIESDGLGVAALITAGVNNATAAGVSLPFSAKPATINIILLLDAHLTRSAMLNAVITATEAKTAVLREKKISTPEGDPATGTSTDTVTIACTGKGALQPYAGPVTSIGWLIARAVRQSLEDSLSAP